MRRRINFKDRAKRQRRTLAVFVLLVVISCVYVCTGALADDPVKYVTITIDSGDTLWEICKENKPDNVDLRNYIDKVKYINKMKTSDVSIGQEIVLPKR